MIASPESDHADKLNLAVSALKGFSVAVNVSKISREHVNYEFIQEKGELDSRQMAVLKALLSIKGTSSMLERSCIAWQRYGDQREFLGELPL
jgi:CRISPR/Cas system-associated protein Cas7 (RAMP superfamily)